MSATDFRYFRGPNNIDYYRLDPDATPDRRVRWSNDGLWVPTDIRGMFDLTEKVGATEIPVDEAPCHLCMLAAGTVTRKLVRDWGDAIAVRPRSTDNLHPANEVGHTLVIPRIHVVDAAAVPALTGQVFARAAELAAGWGCAFNLITSSGRVATQTEPHLHVHAVPRREGDGLQLPWTEPSVGAVVRYG